MDRALFSMEIRGYSGFWSLNYVICSEHGGIARHWAMRGACRTLVRHLSEHHPEELVGLVRCMNGRRGDKG